MFRGFCPAAPFEPARWVETDDRKELERFLHDNRGTCGEDHDGAPVFLARNSWALSRAQQDFPAVRFKKTREQNTSDSGA